MASSLSTISSFSSPPHPQLRKSPTTRQSRVRPVSATTSDKPVTVNTPLSKLPVQELPGGYGLPFIGPIMDRLDYFYNQGVAGFFNTRMEKYKSTVFRANMPPGPFISSDSKVVVLLDGKSFPVLFDVSKVEKKDLFVGTYMPSTKLTGGYRVLSYLDPSEPKHALLKNLLFFMLKSRRQSVIPEFHVSYTEMFRTLEEEIESKGKADFSSANDQAAFNFLVRSYFGVNPTTTALGTEGPTIVSIWLLFQIAPITKLGLPKYLEDLLLHTFPLPPFLIKRDYQKLYNFFYESATTVLDEAVKMGIPRDEACHNLVFATCFNSFGGLKILFPSILKWVGQAGIGLHAQLAEEIRSAVKSNGGVTMAAMEQMPLMKSVVYETLRIEPPVPFQYGLAKKDLVIESHDAKFNIKKGEMIFGYQPFATSDPKIFERPEEFVPDRFVGEEGEKMLRHVLWSNGPETESPTVGDKQCAGKDMVMLSARLLVVELFLRYDTYNLELDNVSMMTSLTKARSL